MSQAEIATKIGSQLASKLQNITDEKVIKTLTIEAWKSLKEVITNPSTFSSRGLSNTRKAIREVFPDSETSLPGYYHTTQGKGQAPRYEHLALWYLTSNTERWEITGDKARKEYFANLPELAKSQPESQPESQPKPQSTFKLENMTLQQLELDTETQQIVQDALNHSGMSLSDFIKQACKVYGTTVVGKAKQAANTDLATIPTSELLNNSSYRTLPGRAEELSTRAIQAITHHNDTATEKSQKWCITGTAINTLTGSKMTLIKNVMEQYKVMIDDHNSKHGLSPYDNRGRTSKIEHDIDFVNFSESNIANQPKPEVITEKKTTPKTTKTEVAKTEVKKQTSKVITLPTTTSTLEILDALKQEPDYKVRIRDGRKAIHYVAIKDENGNVTAMKNEESEEVISI